MLEKAELRDLLRERLDQTIVELNHALQGVNLERLEPVLLRLGRGQTLPHWYEQLRDQQTLPNLDGKTVGSVIEMLFVAVLETVILQDIEIPQFRLNPARGVDIPDLDLGIKAPSQNYATSEPFVSAYERLLGSEYDALIVLTDYQKQKLHPPLKLQVIQWHYFLNTELADFALTAIARKHRDWLIAQNEAWTQKIFRFLAYINQSDWRASRLLRIVNIMQNEEGVRRLVLEAEKDFSKKNAEHARKDKDTIPDHEIESLLSITEAQPIILGIVDAADNWVVENYKDFARLPNENEWRRLLVSPLNGQIGMSFALQWRYNFSRVFRNN
ncbi:MAG: hypothetical protein OXN27_08000 [Candidatus Poribacteria bacterium]|nr:hypothetical protein [Candidatus Poribacteria bacterium]